MIVALGLFLVTGAVNLELPMYARYAEDAGLSAGGLSLSLAGYVGGLLPVLILLGGVSDRVGRRPTILAALACSGVATAFVIAFPGLSGLAAARWFQGFGVALGMGAATAWLGELLGPNGPARAARITGWTTTTGFGAGAVLTAGVLRLGPADVPWSYPLWLALIAVAALAVSRVEEPAPPSAANPILRLPAFPLGSGASAISIGLGWTVAGIVVAVLPGTLRSIGGDLWSGPTLMLLLAAGALAQLHARTLPGAVALRVGAVLLPVGTGLIALGVATHSVAIVIAGALVAGTSTHGYGYLGGLTWVSELPGSRARAISGYFLVAYLGFGAPAVAMGFAVDALGAAWAYAGLASVITAGCSALYWWLTTAAPHPSPAPEGMLVECAPFSSP